MEMVLLDWTRMGRSYCLAGAVGERGQVQVVRPLLLKHRQAPVRNVGWSAYLLDGHARWEIFDLLGAERATPEPPHLEDFWVRGIRPRRCSATLEQRRAILAATGVRPGEPLFGAEFVTTRTGAYLPTGSGQRSLATLLVISSQISFTGARRAGAEEADIRVTLPVPELGPRELAVKDHHLLLRAESGANSLDEQLARMQQAVRQMGDRVAVRIGLSRPFQGEPTRGPATCWLMADGFFGVDDPQP